MLQPSNFPRHLTSRDSMSGSAGRSKNGIPSSPARPRTKGMATPSNKLKTSSHSDRHLRTHSRLKSSTQKVSQYSNLRVQRLHDDPSVASDREEYRQSPSNHRRKGSGSSLYSHGSNNLRDLSPASNRYSPARSKSKRMMDAPSPRFEKHHASKKTIEALQRAVGHERRIASIANACAEFDHWDEDRHTAEINYGAANVLSVILSMTDDDDEVRMLCSALEMVFRGNQKVVQYAFQEVGATVVPILLRILDRCENGTVKHADVSIMNITKTLLYFSRVSELRMALARHQGMLDALVRVATSTLNADCRFARTRIFANLANCDENKMMMLEHDKLLDSLLRIAALDLSDKAREYAGAAIMDLASCPANQIRMANIDKLLGTLVKLAVIEDVAVTRECAITSIQNLAFAKDNRIRLVTYSSGVVLEALKKTLSGDPNDKARRRAAGALTNLACEETAGTMGNHKGLLETLAVVSTKDESNEVQSRASLALTKVASSITCKMACHETLLDSLVVASLSSNVNSVSTVLRVKARDPENRESMACHPGILDTLGDICASKVYTVKDRENSMRAIMHLTNEIKNVKVMCNETILEALVVGVSLEGCDFEGMRESAVVAMERLATEFSNRQYMARHNGLLVAVAKATEREAKLELSGKVVGKPLLAKPLLMSLLVAM